MSSHPKDRIMNQNNIKEDLSADILFSPDRRRVNVYNAKSFREYFI